MSSQQIKQPNVLVDASYLLSIAQKLIMLAALRAVDTFSDIPERDWITIDLKQIHEDTNQTISRKSFYRKMIIGMHKLHRMSLDLPYGKNRKTVWLQDVDANKNESTIMVRIGTTMAELMQELSQGGSYTAINYRSSMLLRSPHAIRIYELLKHWSNTKTVITLEASDLREKLGLQDKYPNVTEFKTKAIQPALDQINQYTELEVQLSQAKNGREISKYIFTLKDHHKKQSTLPKKGAIKTFSKAPKQSPRVTNDNLVPASKLMESALASQGITY